jgi:hypothetical protein
MSEHPDYHINLDVKFGFLDLIDVPGLVAACKERWFNQTLCRVNDCVVRLGVLEGEFHWTSTTRRTGSSRQEGC